MKIKSPNKYWTYTKIGLLVLLFISSFITGPKPIDSGDSPPPFWIVIIPIVFLALFLPMLLRGREPTGQYAQASPWPAYPFSPFWDPYPFWHLGAWVGLTGAVPHIYHALTPYNYDQLFVAIFEWSCAVGIMLGITRTRRALRRQIEHTA